MKGLIHSKELKVLHIVIFMVTLLALLRACQARFYVMNQMWIGHPIQAHCLQAQVDVSPSVVYNICDSGFKVLRHVFSP